MMKDLRSKINYELGGIVEERAQIRQVELGRLGPLSPSPSRDTVLSTRASSHPPTTASLFGFALGTFVTC